MAAGSGRTGPFAGSSTAPLGLAFASAASPLLLRGFKPISLCVASSRSASAWLQADQPLDARCTVIPSATGAMRSPRHRRRPVAASRGPPIERGWSSQVILRPSRQHSTEGLWLAQALKCSCSEHGRRQGPGRGVAPTHSLRPRFWRSLAPVVLRRDSARFRPVGWDEAARTLPESCLSGRGSGPALVESPGRVRPASAQDYGG